jgi:hypothetical protein
MDLQKLNVKWFVEAPNAVPLADFIEIFHSWIQATDGDYHDVADYSHMQAGPGVVLVANDANVSIDETDNRRGLLYSRKSALSGSNQERLRAVARSSLENFRKLEREPKLNGRWNLLGNETVISVNDRLKWPNSDESFAEITAEIKLLAATLFPDAEIALEREADQRKRFAIRIRASRCFAVDELLGRLNND